MSEAGLPFSCLFGIPLDWRGGEGRLPLLARTPEGNGAVAELSTRPILTVEEPALSVIRKSGFKVPFGTISVTQFRCLE